MRDTLNVPDYSQTDISNGLVMVIRNYHWLNSASRVLKSTCSAPLVQIGERKQFSLFDLDLWPTTLTYNPRLAKVKINPRAKNQGQRSNGSNRRVPTDKRRDTHTDATKRIIAPATRSITTQGNVYPSKASLQYEPIQQRVSSPQFLDCQIHQEPELHHNCTAAARLRDISLDVCR